MVTRGENYNRQIFVNQGVWPMFHFAGRISFGVDVGDLLELQSSFEGDRIVDPSPKIEEVGLAEKLPRQAFVQSTLFGLQNVLHFVRNLRQFLH